VLADESGVRVVGLLSLSLSCLPAPPVLGGDPPRPDVGEVHETWSEEDLPEWGDGDGDGEDGAGSNGDGDAGDSGPGTMPDLPSLDPGLSTLRVVEIVADPEGKDGALEGPEWVEILNPSSDAVSLAGLVLEARGWPGTSATDLGLEDTSLMPGQRLTILRFANDVVVPPELPSTTDDAITVGFATGSGLRNADGGVLVRGAMGEVADLVVYGAPQPSPFDAPGAWSGEASETPSSGESLCRPDESVDSDAAGDWASCTPSPGQAPDAEPPAPKVPQTGALVITEVLANPPGPSNEEKLLEFVELLNVDDHAIDLAAFTVADAAADDAPGIDPLVYASGDGGCAPSTCLEPGHRVLIVGDAYAGESGGALVLATDDSTIANGGLGLVEPVLVRDGEGLVVSTYRDWLDPQAEPNPSSQEQSIHRSDAMAPDEPGSWFLAPSSPGQ
jgi:hypothetical protein